MADKQISVRISAQGGKELKAEFVGIGREGKKAFDQLGQSSGSSKAALQNTAFQIQDVFVQVAGGTSITRALSQQMPQLLSGFGLMGVLAGTASAALIPLIGQLFNLEEGSADAKAQIDTLLGTIAELKAANAVYSTAGIQGLIDKYGEVNAAVLLMIERQHQIKSDTVFNAAKVAAASLGSEIEELNDLIVGYDLSMRSAASAPEAKNYKQIIADMGFTIDQARELLAVLDQVRSAQTLTEMVDSAALLSGMIEGTAFGTNEFKQSLLDAEDALRQANAQGAGINSWLDAAVSGAASWAANLWGASDAATAARQNAMAPGDDERGSQRPVVHGATAFVRDQALRNSRSPAKSSGGSGGGGGQNDDLREAQRIYEQTRTEAEKFAVEQEKINRLLDGSYISAETAQRAIDMLGEKYKDAGEAGKYFGDLTGDLKDAFLDLAVEGEASFDRIAKSIERAILQAVIFGEGPLGQALGGGIFGAFGGGAGGGDLFANIGGGVAGARAGGGSVVSGLSYLVGERGPELFEPNGSGIIHKAGSFGKAPPTGGGGTVVQIIDQRSSGQKIQTETKTGPDGREVIIMTVRDATGRGEFDAAQKRFNARPTKVKR